MTQFIDEKMDFERLIPDNASPGQLLKMAREIKRLSPVDVAQQLNLRVQWILDIENDDYRAAAALIYVKGYLRAYARLVGIPSEEVLKAFAEMKFDEQFAKSKPQVRVEQQFAKQQPVFSCNDVQSKGRRNASSRWSMWGGVFVLLLIAVMIAAWFGSPHPRNITRETAAIALTSTAETDTAMASESSIKQGKGASGTSG